MSHGKKKKCMLILEIVYFTTKTTDLIPLPHSLKLNQIHLLKQRDTLEYWNCTDTSRG